MGTWRERNFRLLFVGQTVSAFGNTLVPVALAFAVLDLTGSASDLGDVMAAGGAALVVFLLIGGVLADRLPRRALMVGADATRGCAQLALGLVLVTGHPSVLTIAGLTAVVGIGAALFHPAFTGLLPSLLPDSQLQAANALLVAAASAAGIAGPAVAGLLVVTAGPGWAIIGDSATFFVSGGMLMLLRAGQIPRAVAQHWLSDLRDGWTDFWGRHWFRDVVLGAALFNLLLAAYLVLGPTASREYYDGAAAWATIATAGAIGSVLAGLAAVRLRPRYPFRLGLPLCMLACLAPLAFAGRAPVPVIAAAEALGAGGIVAFATIWQTSIQRNVPERMMSRARSYDLFCSQAAFPLGMAVAGPLATAAGLTRVLLGVGILLVLVAAFLLVVPSVRDLAYERTPADAVAADVAGS